MLTRRNFLAGSIAAAAAGVEARSAEAAERADAPSTNGRAKVYFTRDLSAEGLIKLYGCVNGGIAGRTALKHHAGEPNGPNILPREFKRMRILMRTQM